MHKILWHKRPTWWTRIMWSSPPWVVECLYTAPSNTAAKDVFVICSNIANVMNEDQISVRTHLAWEAWDTRDTSAVLLFKKIKVSEQIEIKNIQLAPWETIWVYSVNWWVTFTAYWEEIVWAATIDYLKLKVLDNTATDADKEMLALLTWWVWVWPVTQNCWCP